MDHEVEDRTTSFEGFDFYPLETDYRSEDLAMVVINEGAFCFSGSHLKTEAPCLQTGDPRSDSPR